MARTQTRTVTVLRAAVPRLLPIARRLLAVAGLVLAGWLLGTSGQASADTVTGPAVVISTSPTAPVTATRPSSLACTAWLAG